MQDSKRPAAFRVFVKVMDLAVLSLKIPISRWGLRN